MVFRDRKYDIHGGVLLDRSCSRKEGCVLPMYFCSDFYYTSKQPERISSHSPSATPGDCHEGFMEMD